MADPLSIASGVAGLLSFGVQITHSLVDFYTAYKGQDTDTLRITENLASLLGTFRVLDTFLHEKRFRPEEQPLLRDIENSIKRCDAIIQELQDECMRFKKEPSSGLKDRIHVAGYRVSYPFRKSTLLGLQEAIDAICDNLSFVMDILQLQNHKSTQDDISELKSLLERMSLSQVSSAIRGWLDAPDASVNHNTACAKRHSGTGLWLLKGEAFQNWREQPNSFLWVNGFAGGGKSVLCSTAIQYTFRGKGHSPGIGIGFFYFDFNDLSKQTEAGALRALILQLSGQVQDGDKDLEGLYQSHGSGSSTPSSMALVAYLRRLCQRFTDVYIFLDALDESPRDDMRDGVLELVATIRQWSLPGLHLFVTSRDLFDIRESLSPIDVQDVSMKRGAVNEDIALWISSQLNQNPKLKRCKPQHDRIQSILTERAQGSFRYAECQLNTLRKAINELAVNRCLNSLPRDLEGTYERILNSVEEDYVDDVRRILTLLCFSARPLTVHELLHAHAVDLTEPAHLEFGRMLDLDGLQDICLGLIEVRPSTKDPLTGPLTVHIAHYSVQEYLQSDHIGKQKAAAFYLSSGASHAEIAQICLVYLLDPQFSRDTLDQQFLEDFPLARFAARYWHNHYVNASDGNSVVEKLFRRLYSHPKCFISSIRLHDPANPRRDRVKNRPLKGIGTPLFYAAFLGLECLIDELVVSVSDLTTNYSPVGTPLHAAAQMGHERVVEMLLDRGAIINTPPLESSNPAPLQTASRSGHQNVVQLLLDRGADINIFRERHGLPSTPLAAACQSRQVNMVQYLLSRGADIHVWGKSSGTALHFAARSGCLELVQLLIDLGADIRARSEANGTVLNMGISGCTNTSNMAENIEIVEMLLDRLGNELDGGFGPYLCSAAYSGCIDVVKILLDRGADVNEQGGRRGTALQYATAQYLWPEKQVEIVELLLDRGADVNAEDLAGNYGNALQNAIFNDHTKIQEILIARGGKNAFD